VELRIAHTLVIASDPVEIEMDAPGKESLSSSPPSRRKRKENPRCASPLSRRKRKGTSARIENNAAKEKVHYPQDPFTHKAEGTLRALKLPISLKAEGKQELLFFPCGAERDASASRHLSKDQPGEKLDTQGSGIDWPAPTNLCPCFGHGLSCRPKHRR